MRPLLFLLAAGCGGGSSAPPPPAECDVVLISLDTARADEVTFEDPEVTPSLCDLARGGVVFTNAVAGSSWTLPSHVELFTGLPTVLHGVHDDGQRIDPLHPTLPELAAERGARTIGVWTGWYLAGAFGFERGFDRYLSAMASHPELDRRLGEDLARGGAAARWAGDVRAAASHADVSSDRAVDLLLAQFEGVAADERLFLFLHLFDPHHDYIPPAPYDTRFDPDYEGQLDGRNWWSNPKVYDPRADPPRRISDRDLEHVRALYRGEIAWCDEQIGRVLRALEERGRLADALVVVTADHGEEFFEHGNRGHRQTLYGEVLRVPLLIVPPGGGVGPRVDDLVSLADVLPTVVDYLGGPLPNGIWGRSLRPRIEGEGLAPRPVSASLGMIATARDGTVHELRLLEAFRTGTVKLVRRTLLAPDGSAQRVESVEWFDLKNDPAELERVAPTDLPRVERAWAAWREHDAALARHELRRSPARECRTDVRAVFAGELAALGYAENGREGSGTPDRAWPRGPLALPALDPAAVGRR